MSEKTPSMFELVGDWHNLIDFGCPVIDETKDSPEEIEEKKAEIEAFEGTLQMLIEAINDKSDAYIAVLRNIEGRSRMLKGEIDKMTALKKAEDNAIARMKESLVYAMNETGRKEIVTDLHTIKVQNNGGKQKMKLTGEVPDNFKRIVYENDTEKIRAALEAGQELDFATLEPRGQHLSIK